MKKTVLSIIILFAVLLLLSCPAVFNPDPFGRWNPADPDYDAATDPDVVVVVTVTRTDSGTQEATWSWTCNITGAAFRHAVNQDDSFAFTNEPFNETTTASASAGDGNGTWYCYVQATTAGGALSAIEMASAVLSADTTGPDCTLRLIKPEAGYYTGKHDSVNVDVSWTVDDTTDVAKFVVRFLDGLDPGTASVKETVDNINTSATSCTANLIGTAPYYGSWQVGAADAAGNITWSAARRIRVGYTANSFNGDQYADILAGSPNYLSTGTRKGRVWLYQGVGRGNPQYVNTWIGPDNSYMGQSVNFIGDFNGDGKTDFAVGDTENDRCRVHISNQSGFPESGFVLLDGPAGSYEVFGTAMDGGDFNNDGYDDMAVGASGYPDGTLYGRVYLYLGNAGGTLSDPLMSDQGIVAGSQLGNSLVMADIDNDGYDDIIAGAAGQAGPDVNGVVYVYFGGASPDLTADLEIDTGGIPYFGAEVAAGDINGDGYADIIIGSPGHDGSYSNMGAVYIYQGGERDAISVSPVQTLVDIFYGNTNFKAGYSVDCGDVTGDGYDDILVGSPGYESGTYGGVWIYHGKAAETYSYDIQTRLYDGFSTGYAGQCVSAGGDVDNDGIADIVYAIPGGNYNYTNDGIVGIVWGAASPNTAGYQAAFSGMTAEEQLGGIDGGGASFAAFNYGRTVGR